jgi:hypothetical protein
MTVIGEQDLDKYLINTLFDNDCDKVVVDSNSPPSFDFMGWARDNGWRIDIIPKKNGFLKIVATIDYSILKEQSNCPEAWDLLHINQSLTMREWHSIGAAINFALEYEREG